MTPESVAALVGSVPDVARRLAAGWRFAVAVEAPPAEVTWSAPWGWPDGGCVVELDRGDNATRAAVGAAVRGYEARMRLERGPEGEAA